MVLRENQEVIAQKIDDNFREKNKRFVGVKLPTGGGKSFLFMDQFEKFMNEYNLENTLSDDIISNVPAIYYTPTNGIVSQTQLNIIRYIILNEYIKKFYKGDIKEAIDKIGDRIAIICSTDIDKDGNEKVNERKYQEYLKKVEDLYNQNKIIDRNPEEIIQAIFEEFLPIIENDYSKIVKKEFPKLEIMCYKNIEDIDISKIDKDTRLITFDEAHKTGSANWGKKAEELLEKLRNTKFLSITATPERDVDGFDPMEYFAALSGSYTPSELRNKSYLASDMTLVEALNNGMVTMPEVVTFDCLLDETREYAKIKEILINAQKILNDDYDKHVKKQRKNPGAKTSSAYIKHENEYNKLLYNFIKICKITGKLDFIKEYFSKGNVNKDIVDFLNKYKESDTLPIQYDIFIKIKDIIFEIDDEKSDINVEYQKWKMQKVKDIIEREQKIRGYIRNGKHICFSPRTTVSENSKDIMFKYKEKIEDFFDISEEDTLITHGNTEVISARDDKNNLNRFMLSSKNLDSPLVMIAMDKFNEGLHVDGIVALEMFRQFEDNSVGEKDEPRITFLQQIGRAIRSIKKRRSC